MTELFVAQTDPQNGSRPQYIRSELVNRHGCITGATGTGKTVSLQVLAEQFSRMGVPVFMADVKGDLTGISKPGTNSEKLQMRLSSHGLPTPDFRGTPVTLWDVFGEMGHPIRATVDRMGPLLLSALLELNDTQAGVINSCFKYAKDKSMKIDDLDDLKDLLAFAAENAAQFRSQYGNISPASVGAIQRALLRLETQGADQFFGYPDLNIDDLFQTDRNQGIVNILAADRLIQNPMLYSTFLLWILSEIYNQLPEVGDLDKPKFAFFFDEAHLLFNNCSKALLEKVEQIVRLIRSKGVGVYFVTQSPIDIPDQVLGQLGHRIQHALRAYTPRDQKAVRSVAETMRPNPALNIARDILELGVGEALVSFLDEKGRPNITERVWIATPGSRLGPVSDEERKELIESSLVAGVYEKVQNRQSASETISAAREQQQQAQQAEARKKEEEAAKRGGIEDFIFGSDGPRGGHRDGILESVAKSVVRSQARKVVNGGLEALIKGVLGSLFKK